MARPGWLVAVRVVVKLSWPGPSGVGRTVELIAGGVRGEREREVGQKVRSPTSDPGTVTGISSATYKKQPQNHIIYPANRNSLCRGKGGGGGGELLTDENNIHSLAAMIGVHSLTHPLLTHPPTHSLTHSLTHSFPHLCCSFGRHDGHFRGQPRLQ